MIDPTKKTQTEFEKAYEDSEVRNHHVPGLFQIQPDGSQPRMISMPCTCEDGGGPTHWAAINNTTESIQRHLEDEECLKSLREN